MGNTKSLSFISVILSTDGIDELVFKKYIYDLGGYLYSRYYDYEIIVVEQHNSEHRYIDWKDILSEVPSIRVIQISNQLDKEMIYFVGFENSIGDYVLTMNPSTDPLELIERSITINKSGVDIVAGHTCTSEYSFLYKCFRPLANIIFKKIGFTNKRNITGFYCLTRNAVNTITLTAGRKYNLNIRIYQSSLKKEHVGYDFVEGTVIERKTIINSMAIFMNMVIFNSVLPLKLASRLGIYAGLISMSYAVYSLVQKLSNDSVVEGWTSIILLTSFLFIILFVILSFFSEYLSRLLDENESSTKYWVVNELNSNIMVDEERLNVLD